MDVMFSVVVRGLWLIMEVVLGYVVYVVLFCVLKFKKCIIFWKNGFFYSDIKYCNWDWCVEVKLLVIYYIFCEVLIISVLDNKCIFVWIRIRLKVYDYL